MIHRQLSRLILGAVCASSIVLPGFAQETNKEAKKLGRKGIYGSSSLESIDEQTSSQPKKAAPTEAERKEALEKQKRLKAKYPLSRTSYTANNQRASQFLFKGIQQYKVVRARFDAINDISSTFDEQSFLLRIKQKGVIPERLQVQDLLKYGPAYAHIGLKIRALKSADKLTASALANFSQARALAPSIAVTSKWIKITKDTRQALQYHARFYQLSLKAVEMGYTKEQLEQLALQWNAGPKHLGPESQLTTRVYARMFARPEKEGKEREEKLELDAFKDQLPNLDFEVKDF